MYSTHFLSVLNSTNGSVGERIGRARTITSITIILVIKFSRYAFAHNYSNILKRIIVLFFASMYFLTTYSCTSTNFGYFLYVYKSKFGCRSAYTLLPTIFW